MSSSMFIAGTLPVLSERQQLLHKAAWRVKDRHAKQRKPSTVTTTYRSPEYQIEYDAKQARLAAEKAERRAAGNAKRTATLAAKRELKNKNK